MHSERHPYYIYIMTNRSKTLYTGATGYLKRRVVEHKQGIKGEFAAQHKIDRLVYFERFDDIRKAIAREKKIKGLLRIKKISLIVSMNPAWKDLSEGWYPDVAEVLRRQSIAWRWTALPQDDTVRAGESAANKLH